MTASIRRTLACLALALLGLGVATALNGGTAARASALLEILVEPGSDRRIVLEQPDFAALPQTTLVTETPWTSGPTRFSGVLLRDLLAALGLPLSDVAARALNDYEAHIPASDIESYDVLVADSLEGEPMAIRDKGPLWIIYPLSAHSELRSADTEAKMVWQLFRLTLE